MLKGKNYKQWIYNHQNEYDNMTELAEACADHFEVITEKGLSEEEELIFDIATDFFTDFYS